MDSLILQNLPEIEKNAVLRQLHIDYFNGEAYNICERKEGTPYEKVFH